MSLTHHSNRALSRFQGSSAHTRVAFSGALKIDNSNCKGQQHIHNTQQKKVDFPTLNNFFILSSHHLTLEFSWDPRWATVRTRSRAASLLPRRSWDCRATSHCYPPWQRDVTDIRDKHAHETVQLSVGILCWQELARLGEDLIAAAAARRWWLLELCSGTKLSRIFFQRGFFLISLIFSAFCWLCSGTQERENLSIDRSLRALASDSITRYLTTETSRLDWRWGKDWIFFSVSHVRDILGGKVCEGEEEGHFLW